MKSSAAPGLALMVLGCMGRLAGVSWHCDAVMAGYGHAPAMAADSLTLAGGGQHHRPPQPVSQKSILCWQGASPRQGAVESSALPHEAS